MTLKSRHSTADGTSMLIAEMDSDHLLNWIDYCIRAVEKVATDFMRSMEEAQVEQTPFTKAFDSMYGIERRSPEVSAAIYASAVNKLVSTLEPYFTEVFIRNFTDAQNYRIGTLRARFQVCVGRSQRLSTHSAPKLIDGLSALPQDYEDSFDYLPGDS